MTENNRLMSLFFWGCKNWTNSGVNHDIMTNVVRWEFITLHFSQLSNELRNCILHCCYWFGGMKTFQIMRAFIYLLFPLCLRNLLFPWLLIKMLLTIFLKIPYNVIEVMVVLMLLLLALKFVESGVHHTCGGGHNIVCTSPPPTLLDPIPNFLKEGEAWTDLNI